MTLELLLIVAAGLLGIGVYGALSQQSFVMLMMGIELMINGVILAAGALWALAAEGSPKGQALVVVLMLVMAVEMVIGFALVVAVYRARGVDMTEGLDSMRE